MRRIRFLTIVGLLQKVAPETHNSFLQCVRLFSMCTGNCLQRLLHVVPHINCLIRFSENMGGGGVWSFPHFLVIWRDGADFSL